MEIEGIVMTDLVQKIADAVDAAWGAWSDDANDERPFIVVQREAIRQALAQGGEAVSMSKLVRTAPERIYLNISDEDEHKDEPFYECHEVTWSEDPAVNVTVPYVRADLYPAPTSQAAPSTDGVGERIAELEAHLVAEYGLSERWRQRTLAAEKQLAESEKKREAVTSDWSKLGAKLGLLQMQLGATERQLAESREREGRMRGVLEAFDKAARESGSIIGFAGKAFKLITNVRAALAADKEKNDE